MNRNQLLFSIFALTYLSVFYCTSNFLYTGKIDKENRTPRKVYVRERNRRICRLCVKESDRVSKFFSQVGKEKQFAAKVYMLFGLKVLEGDSDSNVLCEKCERKLESFWNFRNEILKAQESMSRNFSVKRVVTPPKKPASTYKVSKSGMNNMFHYLTSDHQGLIIVRKDFYISLIGIDFFVHTVYVSEILWNR